MASHVVINFSLCVGKFLCAYGFFIRFSVFRVGRFLCLLCASQNWNIIAEAVYTFLWRSLTNVIGTFSLQHMSTMSSFGIKMPISPQRVQEGKRVHIKINEERPIRSIDKSYLISLRCLSIFNCCASHKRRLNNNNNEKKDRNKISEMLLFVALLRCCIKVH